MLNIYHNNPTGSESQTNKQTDKIRQEKHCNGAQRDAVSYFRHTTDD